MHGHWSRNQKRKEFSLEIAVPKWFAVQGTKGKVDYNGYCNSQSNRCAASCSISCVWWISALPLVAFRALAQSFDLLGVTKWKI